MPRGLRAQRIHRLRIFVDAGESAKTADRPAFTDLLAYCRKEKGRVRAWSTPSTPLSWSSADHHAIVSLLRGFGITLRSMTEPIDKSPSGKLMEGILAAMAQFDNDVRSERVVAGMNAAVERGRWVWLAPIGYRTGDRRQGEPSLVPKPIVRRAVRETFELAARGIRGRELLERATALCIRRRTGTTLPLNRVHDSSVIRSTPASCVPQDGTPTDSATLNRLCRSRCSSRCSARCRTRHAAAPRWQGM